MFTASLRRLAGILVVLFSIHASAQQYHFIYLQTENGQPFYVKLDNKILSSSSAGYIILPKIIDSGYNLTIGFPKNEFPEQKFHIDINNTDEGYLLKNFGDKGWGLFNLQNFGVIMSASSANSQATDTVAKVYSNDPFSKMLANVVKDSTILQKKEPPKIVEETNVSKADTSMATANNDTAVSLQSNNPTAAVPEHPDTTLAAAVHNDSTAIAHNDTSSVVEVNTSMNYFIPPHKVFSDKSDDGTTMMYVDTFPKERDTILIFIPADTAGIKAIADTKASDSINPEQKNTTQVQVDTTSELPAQKDTVAVKDTTSSMPPLVTIKNYSPPPGDTVISRDKKGVASEDSANRELQPNIKENKNQPESVPEVVTFTTTNSDCKDFADNNDFLKLRKRMASENSDDNMIKVAKKYFKSKCFSTEQIKNLSFLFLTNQSKYEFFDAAYAFVSDSEKYYTLESQFTDTYYLNRFKAMVQR